MKKQYNITRHANGFLVERGDRLYAGGGFASGGSGGSGGVSPEAFFFDTAAAMAAWIEKDLGGGAFVFPTDTRGAYITMFGGGSGGGGGNEPLPTYPKRTRKRKAKGKK